MTNKVILNGNLGADAEGFLTKTSMQGARFRVATTSTWKNPDGEEKSATEWHRVVVFGAEATWTLDQLRKGRRVEIEGRLQTRSYTDRDGVKRYDTSVVADKITVREAPKDEAE